jgi:hypothetical protein
MKAQNKKAISLWPSFAVAPLQRAKEKAPAFTGLFLTLVRLKVMERRLSPRQIILTDLHAKLGAANWTCAFL